MPVRILLIDDHALFRGGVRMLLSRQTDFEVVGEASDGAEGVKRALQLRPDLVLLDLDMPGMSGREVLGALVEEVPGVEGVDALEIRDEGRGVGVEHIRLDEDELPFLVHVHIAEKVRDEIM